jgi:anti-sigma regulatory factor (Ser/Thr protein kinase)
MSATVNIHDLTMVLPCERLSVRTARRELGRLLRGAGWAPLDVERALLAVTELVANAVVHARSAVVVRCRVGGHLRLDVTDTAADAELGARPATPEHMDGRGLSLVETMSSRWGVDRGPWTKTVWCELAPAEAGLADTG